MHFSPKAALLSVLIALSYTNAQISSLPSCAQPAANSGISGSGCTAGDIKCLCSATSFLTSLQSQVKTACGDGDYQTTITFAVTLCQSVGVSLPVNQVGQGYGAASAAAPTTTSSAAAEYGSGESAPSPAAAGEASPVASSSSTGGSGDSSSGDYSDEDEPPVVAAVSSTTDTGSAHSAAETSYPTATSSSTYANSTNTTITSSTPVPFTGGAETLLPIIGTQGNAMLRWTGVALIGVGWVVGWVL